MKREARNVKRDAGAQIAAKEACKRGVTIHVSEFIFHFVQYWLVKQEPEDYSWTTFAKGGRAVWTGVRNFAAHPSPGDEAR